MSSGMLNLPDSVTDSLAKELSEEKCAFQYAADGSFERVVAVVALRLERADGRILAQLASLRGSHLKVACELPGIKRAHGELPQKTFQRLLEHDLSPFARDIHLE